MTRRPRELTVREAAALLALLLLSACGGGGGGGIFSPLAPGVAAATPAPTLNVAPAMNVFPAVGSTATVVATISTGASGVAVTYAGGCESVATVSPTTQTTLNGSTPPYTLTATSANTSCTARFVAGAASGSTVAEVGNPPSPGPSPAPSSSPTAPSVGVVLQ